MRFVSVTHLRLVEGWPACSEWWRKCGSAGPPCSPRRWTGRPSQGRCCAGEPTSAIKILRWNSSTADLVVVGTPPCGAEPRIELGPALLQADALPKEPRRTTSDEEMERGFREWRRINVLYECDWMSVCMYVIKIWKNKQKEWHPATKPFKF